MKLALLATAVTSVQALPAACASGAVCFETTGSSGGMKLYPGGDTMSSFHCVDSNRCTRVHTGGVSMARCASISDCGPANTCDDTNNDSNVDTCTFGGACTTNGDCTDSRTCELKEATGTCSAAASPAPGSECFNSELPGNDDCEMDPPIFLMVNQGKIEEIDGEGKVVQQFSLAGKGGSWSGPVLLTAKAGSEDGLEFKYDATDRASTLDGTKATDTAVSEVILGYKYTFSKSGKTNQGNPVDFQLKATLVRENFVEYTNTGCASGCLPLYNVGTNAAEATSGTCYRTDTTTYTTDGGSFTHSYENTCYAANGDGSCPANTEDATYARCGSSSAVAVKDSVKFSVFTGTAAEGSNDWAWDEGHLGQYHHLRYSVDVKTKHGSSSYKTSTITTASRAAADTAPTTTASQAPSELNQLNELDDGLFVSPTVDNNGDGVDVSVAPQGSKMVFTFDFANGKQINYDPDLVLATNKDAYLETKTGSTTTPLDTSADITTERVAFSRAYAAVPSFLAMAGLAVLALF